MSKYDNLHPIHSATLIGIYGGRRIAVQTHVAHGPEPEDERLEYALRSAAATLVGLRRLAERKPEWATADWLAPAAKTADPEIHGIMTTKGLTA
jgi:hypothetical protein